MCLKEKKQHISWNIRIFYFLSPNINVSLEKSYVVCERTLTGKCKGIFGRSSNKYTPTCFCAPFSEWRWTAGTPVWRKSWVFLWTSWRNGLKKLWRRARLCRRKRLSCQNWRNGWSRKRRRRLGQRSFSVMPTSERELRYFFYFHRTLCLYWSTNELFYTFRSLLSSLLFLRSVLECEKLVKATYRKNGLVYRESSSEDEGGGAMLSSEVIEIDDDDDDDVIAVGCCKSGCLVMNMHVCNGVIMPNNYLFFFHPSFSVVPPKKPLTPVKDPVVRATQSIAVLICYICLFEESWSVELFSFCWLIALSCFSFSWHLTNGLVDVTDKASEKSKTLSLLLDLIQINRNNFLRSLSPIFYVITRKRASRTACLICY